MRKFCRIITSIAVCTILLVNVVQAGQIKATHGFSATAGELLAIVKQMQVLLPTTASPDDLRAKLIQLIEDWQVCWLLVEERLRSRENRLQNGNATARTRHQVFAERLHGRRHQALRKQLLNGETVAPMIEQKQ